MTKMEAREMIEAGYYGNTLDADEILGLAFQWFPEFDQDATLEEIVAEICFG